MSGQDPPLQWRDGQPLSARYGDVYFSRESGIEETRHVFLQRNRLRERWQALQGDVFTIAETGFGTGLNFLCAWQLWDTCAPADARLHFVSTEQHPLSREELTRALALWPQLETYSRRLLAEYRWLVPGWQQIGFDGGRVTLTLVIGDARATLPQLRARVDAWFLDGFAPDRNPELWQDDLLREIARLCAPGATFATYTSAGAVRRGLAAAGFTVRKVAGYGCKRDMLCGEIGRAVMAPAPCERRAVIIGGGIGGCASAWQLARRGWQVTLIERHPGLAQEASGNAQGVLYPRLSGHDIPLSRIALAGFLTTRRLLPELLAHGTEWDDCGLLQLAFDAREARRCREVAARGLPQDLLCPVDAAEAGRLAGVEMPHGGLWLPAAGWAAPPALCRALASHPGIRVRAGTEALRLMRGAHGWQVHDAASCIAEAPTLVLAAASDCRRFAQSTHLPLLPVRGQTTLLPATEPSRKLRAVVCADGYISPARAGMHCLGASFHPQDTDTRLRAADHAGNLAMLRQLSPALHRALDADALDCGTLAGRAALRCASPDYLPLAGPLLDAASLAGIHAPGSRPGADRLPWLDGLHVNAGHGARGLLTAPLAGELIAATLTGEPLPVDAGSARALDPNRFLLRSRGLRRLIGAVG